MLVHIFNPSSQETEPEDLWIWEKPGLQSQDNQGYIEKPYLEKTRQYKTKSTTTTNKKTKKKENKH